MSERHRIAATAVMAMMFAAMAVAVQPAQAAIDGSGHVYLLNNGATTLNATTDWRFYVEKPSYLALDAEYWNFTCYGEMVNNTGNASTGTYVVTVYVDDGAVIRSATGSIAVSKTAKVYGNISFGEATIGLFAENRSAQVTYKLTLSSVQKDILTAEVPITERTAYGLLYVVAPALLAIAVVSILANRMRGK